jgi:hypothetical protein
MNVLEMESVMMAFVFAVPNSPVRAVNYYGAQERCKLMTKSSLVTDMVFANIQRAFANVIDFGKEVFRVTCLLVSEIAAIMESVWKATSALVMMDGLELSAVTSPALTIVPETANATTEHVPATPTSLESIATSLALLTVLEEECAWTTENACASPHTLVKDASTLVQQTAQTMEFVVLMEHASVSATSLESIVRTLPYALEIAPATDSA